MTSRVEINEVNTGFRRHGCFKLPPLDKVKSFHVPDVQDCIMCGEGLGVLGFDPSDPSFVGLLSTKGGINVQQGLMTAQLGALIADPSTTLVLASDVLGTSTGSARGIVLDQAGQVRGVVSGTKGGGIGLRGGTTFVGKAAVAPPPAIAFVAAVSGARQEATLFERASTGLGGVTLRVYDFDLNTVEVKHLLPAERPVPPQSLRSRNDLRALGQPRAASEGRIMEAPQSPVAATYRTDDDAYYLLDRTAGEFVLYRIGLELVPRSIARWRDTSTYTKYELTTGARGALVVSASSVRAHAIGVLIVGGDGSLGTRVVLTGAGALDTSVIVNESGLSYALSQDGPFPQLVREVLPLSTGQNLSVDDIRAIDADVAAMSPCF